MKLTLAEWCNAETCAGKPYATHLTRQEQANTPRTRMTGVDYGVRKGISS